VDVTEMMTYDWSTITAYVSVCFLDVFNYKLRIHCLHHF